MLKGYFLEGKQNRRVDHLISTLLEGKDSTGVLPHFMHKHHCQVHGFDGLNLIDREHARVQKLAQVIASTDIVEITPGSRYLGNSQTNRSRQYLVISGQCPCLSFPTIHFCKHMGAIQMKHHGVFAVDTFVNGSSTQHAPPVETQATLSRENRAFAQLAAVMTKLEHLTNRVKSGSASDLINHPVLLQLGDLLDPTLIEVEGSQILPKKQTIAQTSIADPRRRR